MSLVASRAHADTALAPSSESEAKPSERGDTRAEAERHFQRGLELANRRSWDAALAEFLTSRELFPTRSATRNAAIAQLQLGRAAECVELYQNLLREFSREMPPEQVELIRRELNEARAHTAQVVIESREPGVNVALDGKLLGTTPLGAEVAVNAGTHSVRLSKDGFETNLQTFTVAVGMRKLIASELRPLSNTGQLVVREATGSKLAVYLDGSWVGTTPWSAVVAGGSHLVQLRGDDGTGTAPGAASVRDRATLVLVLQAVRLDANLRVEPAPSTALVALDGVLVGAGVWDGALPSGSHRVEVSAAGYAPFRRWLELRAGQPAVVRAQLEASGSPWQPARPSPLYAEATLSALLASSLHAGADDACDCGSIAAGGSVAARLGYTVLPRLSLEAGLGALTIAEKLRRELELQSDTGLAWTSSNYRDSIRLTGPFAALGPAFRSSGKWPFTARLTAGVALLHTDTSSSGTFVSHLAAGSNLTRSIDIPEQSTWLLTPFIESELRLGYRISQRISVDVGVGLSLFFPVARERRGVDEAFGTRATALPQSGVVKPGVVSLPNENVAGAFLALSPGAGLRVGF
jgi:hypothetical protein